MAEDRGIQFGSVLDRETADKKVWLLVVPAILLLVGGAVWALGAVSRADGLVREADRARAQVAELQKSLDERDKLLVQARKDEAVLTSAGQATALFYGVSPQATESGVVVGLPDQHAARLVLYGLVAPPGGQEYVAVARLRDGSAKPLGRIVPSDLGTAFLLAKDVPEGTTAVELDFRPAGQESIDGAAAPRGGALPRDAGGSRDPDAARDAGAARRRAAVGRRSREAKVFSRGPRP
jgi:hypothetical protein